MKNLKTNNLPDIGLFPHEFQYRVQFADVDSFGVTHNLRYLYFFEQARVEYIRSSGIPINPRTFLTEFPLMVVKNTADYYAPSKFDDILTIKSRIKKLGSSSIEFENLAVSESGEILTHGTSVMVHLDAKTGRPEPVPAEIKKNLLSPIV